MQSEASSVSCTQEASEQLSAHSNETHKLTELHIFSDFHAFPVNAMMNDTQQLRSH